MYYTTQKFLCRRNYNGKIDYVCDYEIGVLNGKKIIGGCKFSNNFNDCKPVPSYIKKYNLLDKKLIIGSISIPTNVENGKIK